MLTHPVPDRDVLFARPKQQADVELLRTALRA